MSRIGMQIKQIRAKKGITQKQLAKKLGVSDKYIDEVEIGKKVINDALIKKISKILEVDINDSMMYESEDTKKEQIVKTESTKVKQDKDTQVIWNDAFASVLKQVPFYKYTLDKPISTRQMPIISNKIEGYNKDKVFFVEIEDDDMLGFRIAQGDVVFCYMTHELENNGIHLVEYNERRCIRQIKRLDSVNALLISNKNSLKTDTVSIKDIKILAKLIKLEIKL